MQNNSKYLIATGLLLCSMFAYSQASLSNSKSDTVFVYETITVYDTVYLNDTIKVAEKINLPSIEPKSIDLTLLQLDTISNKAVLLLISRNQTATIPLNGIILNENIKNLESMKKVSFLGVVLFAFQSMVMAQSDFGISAGGGTWWANSTYKGAEAEFSPTINVGAFYQLPISNRFKLKTGLNYHFLFSNYSYKTVIETQLTNGVDSYTKSIYLGDGAAASNYHQLSIPLQVGYRLGKISSFIGAEYAYRIPDSWLIEQTSHFGLLFSIDYKISEKFSLDINYYNGLTKDYEYKGDLYDPMLAADKKVGEYDVSWKSSRVGLTLHYTFNKKKTQE